MGPALKNRKALADHFALLGFSVGAEIGVCHGEYSKVLLTAIPGVTLYGVDSYRRRPSDRRLADQRLGHWIAERRFILMQMSSMRAVRLFEDATLDFVFIDANHAHPAVDQDIAAWTPKVRSGGIVSGHDYMQFKSGFKEVIEAVDRYVSAHPSLILQTTAADPTNRDKDCRQPCWWWVQP